MTRSPPVTSGLFLALAGAGKDVESLRSTIRLTAPCLPERVATDPNYFPL